MLYSPQPEEKQTNKQKTLQQSKKNKTNMSKKEEHNDNEKVILVVGACCLDRLIQLQKYPIPDSKIRATNYTEYGGGNAANTASTMGLLSNSTIFSSSSTISSTSTCQDKNTNNNTNNIKIKLLTKVGNDSIGQQLIKELNNSNVITTTSSMFKIGNVGTTTSFTTVLVSTEELTRTCIFTRGSCGELTINDLSDIDYNKLFYNVIHLHTDSRHTKVSLELVKEIKKRNNNNNTNNNTNNNNISISIDCEKDRNTKDLDKLLELSDIVFTNSNVLDTYLKRLENDMQLQLLQQQQQDPIISICDGINHLDKDTIDVIIKSLQPSIFFVKWFGQLKKHVIVTHGNMGALHFQPQTITKQQVIQKQDDDEVATTTPAMNDIQIVSYDASEQTVHIQHKFSTVTTSQQKEGEEDNNNNSIIITTVNFIVHKVGVVKNLNIVDTTGAGDAFIGGYLMSNLFCNNNNNNNNKNNHTNNNNTDSSSSKKIQFDMEFATWVSGMKLEGPGARKTLPNGTDVNKLLGNDYYTIQTILKEKLTSFNPKR